MMQLKYLLICGLLPLALVGGARADECDPNDATLLKPNLVALPPTRVRTLQRQFDRKIIFTTTVGNVGQGPFILEAQTVQSPSGPVTQATQRIWRQDGSTCTHVAGYFVFHPSHHHWHFNDFSSYELRKDDPFTGQLVAQSSKVSFCLIDITQLRGFTGPRQVFGDCTNQQGTQGISVGFADVYDSFLPDQWIDLDLDRNHPVLAGDYYLLNVADPDNLIMETDDNLPDKTGVVSVSVPALIGGGLPGTPIPTGTPVPTGTPRSPHPGRRVPTPVHPRGPHG